MLYSLQRASFFKYRLANGLLKKHIRVHVNILGAETDLVDAFMNPGEEIWILLPTNTTATVFLYEDEELVKTRVFDKW